MQEHERETSELIQRAKSDLREADASCFDEEQRVLMTARSRDKEKEPLRVLWSLDPNPTWYERDCKGKLHPVRKRINGFYHYYTETIMVHLPEVLLSNGNWTGWTVFRVSQVLLHEMTHWGSG